MGADGGEDDDEAEAAYPGAVNIANLLRVVAWVWVIAYTLLGLVVGAAMGGGHLWSSSSGSGATAIGVFGGGLLGAALGVLLGALAASGIFALSYVLLLLDQIEFNTRHLQPN